MRRLLYALSVAALALLAWRPGLPAALAFMGVIGAVVAEAFLDLAAQRENVRLARERGADHAEAFKAELSRLGVALEDLRLKVVPLLNTTQFQQPRR